MSKPLFAIIAAMQPELDYLLDQLQQRNDIEMGAFKFHVGKIDHCDVVLALSGIGKVNAAVTTAIVIERFAPQYVINTGSAGGLGQGMQIGDVVIGTEVAHHDVDVTAFGYDIGQVPQLPSRYHSAQSLIQAAKLAVKESNHQHGIHQGLIVSGDQFIGTAEQNQKITNNFPDVLAVEMEAAAIAQTCHQLSVAFVIIRAISDNGDAHASISFDEFLQVAGKNSAKMVINLINSLS